MGVLLALLGIAVALYAFKRAVDAFWAFTEGCLGDSAGRHVCAEDGAWMWFFYRLGEFFHRLDLKADRRYRKRVQSPRNQARMQRRLKKWRNR